MDQFFNLYDRGMYRRVISLAWYNTSMYVIIEFVAANRDVTKFDISNGSLVGIISLKTLSFLLRRVTFRDPMPVKIVVFNSNEVRDHTWCLLANWCS